MRFPALVCLCAAGLFASCSQQRTIEGQVFIVTEGAANVKLGLVGIHVLDSQTASNHLAGVAAANLTLQHDLADAVRAIKTQIETNNEASSGLQEQLDGVHATMRASARAGELFSWRSINESPAEVFSRQYKAKYDQCQSLATAQHGAYAEIELAAQRRELADLLRQRPDYERRQKLWQEWEPKRAYAQSEAERILQQMTNFQLALGVLEDKAEFAAKRLADWKTIAQRKIFEGLPGALGFTQTDADGRFIVTIPTQERVAIFAEAKRNLSHYVEHYYWLVWVEPHQQRILLSNDNLFLPVVRIN